MNPLLLPFSAGFRLGVALRHAGYKRGWFKIRRLARPVVSVGNLTVGGTGKTPLVACVANILLRQGWKPSILTRGYGRSSKADMIVVAARRRPPRGRAGNRRRAGASGPHASARFPSSSAPTAFAAGRLAEERFQVDAHILDDGFQHLALARDVDVLALDATQTLSDWHLAPRRPPA